jgi:hypothetical protein
VQFPWTQGEDERRRIDGLRLLQQVPAIVSLSMVDRAAPNGFSFPASA